MHKCLVIIYKNILNKLQDLHTLSVFCSDFRLVWNVQKSVAHNIGIRVPISRMGKLTIFL